MTAVATGASTLVKQFEIVVPKPLSALSWGRGPATPIEQLLGKIADNAHVTINAKSAGVYVPMDDAVAAAAAVRFERMLPNGTTVIGGTIEGTPASVATAQRAVDVLEQQLLPGLAGVPRRAL